MTQDAATPRNPPSIQNPHIRDLWGIGKPLVEDYELCKNRINGENSAFWRRAFARSTCAYIEGSIAAMRRFAVEFALKTRPQDLPRISALLGESYFVDKNGEAQKREWFIPSLLSIAMIFRYYAEACDSPYELDRNGDGWKALDAAFKIRNRVMHPKQIPDLEISDAEALEIEKAFCYFWNSFANLWTASGLLTAPTPRGA